MTTTPRRVELSPKADQARSLLSLRVRHSVNAAIRRIRANPDWGAPIPEDQTGIPLRFVNPGLNPANSGLIADFSVQDAGVIYAITYRLRENQTLVWIEDIRPVMMG